MIVVVAYAPTPEGEAALAAAAEEAERRSARLHIVRAVRIGSTENTSAAREKARDVGAERTTLDALASRTAVRGIEVSAEITVVDRPNTVADTVLAVVERQGAELLVVGIRRRSPVGKAVLGSDAQDMLLQAECPVLAIKAD